MLKAWWRLSAAIYYRGMGGLESDLSDELRNRIVDSAVRHVGMLRKVLRETPEDFEGSGLDGRAGCGFLRKSL